jgi:ferrous iron transport protein B
MTAVAPAPAKKIVLVGNPNVGKSVIFRLLTGNYVMVSNFPGTTVEVSRGKMQLGGTVYEIVDTPGVNSLVPQSEDEWVTFEILLREKPDVIIQVADAKSLRRTILITSELVELGIPMILVLNMMDEAEERGVDIDTAGLSRLFSIPVVQTVAIYSQGRRQLLNAIQNAAPPTDIWKTTDSGGEVAKLLDGISASPRFLTVEWLGLGNPDLDRTVEHALGAQPVSMIATAMENFRREWRRPLMREIAEIRNRFLDKTVASFKHKRKSHFVDPRTEIHSRFWLGFLIAGLIFFAWNEIGGFLGSRTPYEILMTSVAGRLDGWLGQAGSSAGARLSRNLLLGAELSGKYQLGLVPEVIHFLAMIGIVLIPFAVLLTRSRSFAHEFGILTRKASTGVPILLVILFLVYEFVGYTGAQTLVGLLENVLFAQYLLPPLQQILPAGIVSEFLIGKFGMISMGLTYALAIVLPVVGTFFIAFGLLEDSGYMPRLSVLSDRLMRAMGLNGKATLPMVLGLGCCTMATMSTRILNSKKERLIATLLLALGIPCSAQLGVILGIAAGFSSTAMIVVVGVVVSQLFLVGFLASRIIKGSASEFIFEIPPIRVPQLKNVALKTWYRVVWYLKEAVPLFLLGTLILFLFDKIQVAGQSLMEWVQGFMAPVLTGILHLPVEAASVFVLGFLRRDYGAAGLFQLTKSGILSSQQAVVSLIVITLFVPCFSSFLMITKEQGIKKAAAITAFIIPFAVAVGGAVSWILRTFDIQFY